MMKKARGKYNPELDLWKFLMAVVIFLYHGNKLLGSEACPILPAGYAATEFFFMTTGFLCAASTEKMKGLIGSNTLVFMKKKIQSLYLYILVAFVPVFYARQVELQTDSFKRICENIVMSANELFMLEVGGVDSGRLYNGPTWYISAMLLALVIIVPLLQRFRNTYIYAFAPICALAIYAYISREFGSINQSMTWTGFAMVGFIRAFAGVSLGCFLYGIVSLAKEKNLQLTRFGCVCLTAFQMGTVAFALFLMQFQSKFKMPWRYDYVAVLCLVIFSLILFSGLTRAGNLLPVKVCKWLGKYSLVIYLNHRAWIYYLNAAYPELSFPEKYKIYVIGTLVLATASLFIVWLLRFIWKKSSPLLKRLFIKTPEKEVAA